MAKRKTTKQRNEELKKDGLQLINYGVKVMFYPNEKQANQIHQTVGCARFTYNNYLGIRKDIYNETKQTLSGNAYKEEYLVPMKQTEEFAFLKQADKFALEAAVEHVEDAYDKFFKKQNKYPKFKTKRKSKKSYTTKFTNNNIELTKDSIKLPKLGKISVAMPKKVKETDKIAKILSGKAKILSVTVTVQGDRYYASINCEEIVELIKKVDTKKVDLDKITGLDLGLKDFLTMTNGKIFDKIANPKHIVKLEKKIAKLQMDLARKQGGVKGQEDSKNYIKQKNKLNKLHAKLANRRRDFHHQLSRMLVNENDIIIVENLNIKGMVKNHNLAKSIHDAGWAQFLTILKYKLEAEGKIYLEVDRWFASSKICSHCKEKKLMLSLDEREWVCSCCGTHHDRDENASKNIREEGMRTLGLLA
jgi:putative transposase